MFVERVLKRRAGALPPVALAYGWRVTGVADLGDHVAAHAESGGATRTWRARYLVGCDGASSLARKHLGIELSGEAGVVRDFMGGRMHMIHVRAPHFYGEIAGRRAWQYWAVNRERRSFMAALDGRAEFVFHTQLRAGESEDSIDEARARRMLHQCYGRAVDFELIVRKSWTAGFTLVAESFHRGRVFLAGDAAHLFTPTGGLGYNTAIEDAVNLGWKLAATIRGWGGPALLASYHAERHPAAVRNTGYARGFADSLGGFRARPELEDDTPEGAAARAEAGAYFDRHGRREFNIPGITFGTRYDGSPILVADGSEPPPDRVNEYVPSACPGGRAPHAWLADGRSLFDAFGFEFTLLRLAGVRDSGRLERAAARIGLPLTVVDMPGEETRDLYVADYALIRPDQTVAWRGDAIGDPAALLDTVRGAAESSRAVP
jgi:2-polyprenyl-6-methoxyphenol hydroxylase-like FAD-dependent oxidoreductase